MPFSHKLLMRSRAVLFNVDFGGAILLIRQQLYPRFTVSSKYLKFFLSLCAKKTSHVLSASKQIFRWNSSLVLSEILVRRFFIYIFVNIISWYFVFFLGHLHMLFILMIGHIHHETVIERECCSKLDNAEQLGIVI